MGQVDAGGSGTENQDKMRFTKAYLLQCQSSFREKAGTVRSNLFFPKTAKLSLSVTGPKHINIFSACWDKSVSEANLIDEEIFY